MTNLKTRKPAFTLIELLIVLSIIAILTTIVFLSISNTRRRAADAKMAADLAMVNTALEQYYKDTGSVPINPSQIPCNIGSAGCLTDLVSKNYLVALPRVDSCTTNCYTYYNYEKYISLSGEKSTKEYGPFPYGQNCSATTSDVGGLGGSWTGLDSNAKKYCEGFLK
ncbi:MAG: type II secretion system protein [Candidatus Berkelbacteria bacterium]|nr:type II secretion system protein [Candidatus Berkelbacteria bacterium]